jgi:TolB-like protein
MEEVLNDLQKIKDFRVLSRTSTDQYKSKDRPTIPEIAKKLGISYIVEGSGQKYGNSYRLRVQLIVGNNERHLWAESYEKEIKGTKDIYGTQSEIAQSIASALKATITPEEKQLINKIPTKNLTAYSFYQQGREEYIKGSLQKAENLYKKSLKYDSTFAQAYSGLARVYWDKYFSKEYFSENFMDSVLILINTALSFDNQLSEPYTLRGRYYSQIGKLEQANEEFDKAIKFNPNDWRAYNEKGNFYYTNNDCINIINYKQKAASINHGPEYAGLLIAVGWAYLTTGFFDKAKQYFQDGLKLDGDSLSYYHSLAQDEFWHENLNKSIEYGEKGYAIDSTNMNLLSFLGMAYEWIGQYKESLKYYKKYLKKLKAQGGLDISGMQRIGYAYWQNGYKEEAEYYFSEQINYCNKSIKLKRLYGQNLSAYYDLAGVYAFRGERDKAYKNLKIFNQVQRPRSWFIMSNNTDPLFNSIRNEPEFQQIVRDVEAKYLAEHERVRKWLEETGQL